MPKPPDNRPRVLWWVMNQEGIPVAVSYAKSQSGALRKFEDATGEDRASYHVRKVLLNNGCDVNNFKY